MATDSPDATGNLAALLVSEAKARSSRRRRWLLFVVLLIAGGAAAFVYLRPAAPSAGPGFNTQPTKIGDLVVKVSATGNLQPTNRVEVSSELSGIVVEVMVDENDRVVKGQVLARLDLAKLQDAVTRSRASLAAAEAQVQQARATVEEAREQLARFEQVAEQSGGKVPSKSEMTTARANVRRARATEASARASVSQARANLQSDETNLGKASITSPIDGIVLSRAVEPGQTVAAALQAPVLFTLAEDLTQMKLRVDVDEADVGQVRVDQTATFTVDAWPGRTYSGVITRVGYGSETKDNVVSYPAVIAVRNDDLSLRPGMTATADIVTVTREGVLLVPNAALRFEPMSTMSASGAIPGGMSGGPPGGRPTGGPPGGRSGGPPGGIMGQLMPRPPGQMPRRPAPSAAGGPKVWVEGNGRPVPVELKTGVTDGQWTEVVEGALEPGVEVITDAASPSR